MLHCCRGNGTEDTVYQSPSRAQGTVVSKPPFGAEEFGGCLERNLEEGGGRPNSPPQLGGATLTHLTWAHNGEVPRDGGLINAVVCSLSVCCDTKLVPAAWLRGHKTFGGGQGYGKELLSLEQAQSVKDRLNKAGNLNFIGGTVD